MHLHASLRARDPRLAARSGACILMVLALLNLVLTNAASLSPMEHTVLLINGLVFSVGAAVYFSAPADLLDRFGVYLGTGLLGVVAASALMVLGGASSAPTPIATLLAVLWASACLRTAAAWVLGVCAILTYTTAEILIDEPINALISSTFLAGGVLLNTLVLSRTLDQQSVLTRELTDLANVDALTGLATRRAFDAAVVAALADTAEAKGTALILVDLDNFKSINDLHGHPVGDRALVHVATTLSRSVRARDTVVGRLGGDELAVLLMGCPLNAAERRAQDLCRAVRNAPLRLSDDSAVQMTVSVGVAHTPPTGLDISDLFTAADVALYEAKRGGRDRVVVAR